MGHLRHVHGEGEQLGDAEVAELDVASGGEEDVGGLKIAVQQPQLVVAVRQRGDQLRRPAEHVGLRERAHRALALRDETAKVTACGPLHHNAEGVEVDERLLVPDDVRMVQRLQDLHLVHRRLALGRGQAAHRHFLEDEVGRLAARLDEPDRAERPLPDPLHLGVLIRRH